MILQGKLNVHGQAKIGVDISALLASTQKSLADGELGAFDVSPPTTDNYIWSVKGDLKLVDVDGYVPSENIRKEIKSDVRASYPSAIIKDNSIVANGAPDGFLEAAKLGIKQLNYSNSGLAEIYNGRYSLVIGSKDFSKEF